MAPGGNNGIKYWVTKVGGREWLGIEYQMIDAEKHPDGLKGGSHTTAFPRALSEALGMRLCGATLLRGGREYEARTRSSQRLSGLSLPQRSCARKVRSQSPTLGAGINADAGSAAE